jgi:hypothetical protein
MKQRHLIQWVALTLIFYTIHVSAANAEIIGMWLLNEGNGKAVQDTSGRKHTGTLMGGAKWAKGKFGQGVELDKSGFIEWQHHEDFNFKESLTIMIQARIDNITPQEWVGMPRKEGEYVMAAHKLGDKMEMTFWINIGGWIGQIPAGGQFPAHKFGEWHHYAVIYDGKEVLLYLDGKDAGGQKVAGQMSQTGAVLHVSNSCCGGRFMEAVVDEFVMANHAMKQDEIASFAEKGIELTLAVEPHGKLTTTWAKIKQTTR